LILASSDFGLSFALEWVAVAIVGWIIVRYVVPPLRRLMNQQTESIKEQLSAGQRAREEGERLLAERREALSRAKADAQAIVAQARRNADSLVAEGEARADQEYEHALRRAEQAVELSLAQVREEVLARVGGAVVQTAQKVVAAELDPQNHHRLIGEAIAAAESESAV